jgi:two-component system, cell cycle response regulator
MRILIAEDDNTSRSMLKAVLKKSGHDVIEAVDGAAALAAMQQHDAAQLAILDWMMPEMDGLEVVRRIRALTSPLPPYIIMLTARGDKTDIIAGLNAGADDYLTKPFDAGELRARVDVGRRLVEMQAALAESRDVLAYQATHDPLTGILNRRAIIEHLKIELARAERYGDGLAVGMCDIDHFKLVNDEHGHQTGDDVLCALAQIFSDYVRKYDSVGRIGGEEFLLVTSMRGGQECSSIYDRLCSVIADSKLETRSGVLSVTVSIGVYCDIAGNSVDDILGTADAALYKAKELGRNRVVYATCNIEGEHNSK